MTTRRQLLTAFGAGLLSAPLACLAQQQRSKIAQIGLLEATSASDAASRVEGLRLGLRELGLVEGKTIIIEYRWADGKNERLPAMAAELMQMKVDLILAGGNQAITIAQKATTSIPIVMVRAGDPVGSGYVASLARPGGNITGLASFSVDLSTKYLELLRDAVPKLSRVTVLTNPRNPNLSDRLKQIQVFAKTKGVVISSVEASSASEFEAAFAATKQARAGALIVLPDAMLLGRAHRIAEFARQQRLPTMFSGRDAVESCGLMSYGANNVEQFHRAATYIDKILKGAKPGDLPVEQPTKLELVINLKTAKAIGLTLPQELLFRADKVIE